MAGKHRAKKRQPEAYVWLGTGAMTLGLGVALAAGSGVAQADATNASVSGSGVTPSSGSSAATTSIRTTISAQSVNTSTQFIHARGCGRGTSDRSIVTTKDSVVRQMDSADTGDNDPRDGFHRREPAARTRQQRSWARSWSRYCVLVPIFRSSSWAVVVAACSRGSQVLSASSAVRFLVMSPGAALPCGLRFP